MNPTLNGQLIGTGISLKMIETKHLVVDYSESPWVFRCNHCSKTFPAPNGCSIDFFLAVSEAFKKEHRYCLKVSDETKND
jgi:hypothetical protein